MFKLMHVRRATSAGNPYIRTRARALEDLLRERRSVRKFENNPLELSQVSQLMWSAQGQITDCGRRTAPSAGGLYPLAVRVCVGNVDSLGCGLYKYHPKDHTLTREREGDFRELLCAASFAQPAIRLAPIDIVISADYNTITGRYHERGLRYIHMEAGHAAQNVYLLATALGLATVAVGAFDDEQVERCLTLPPQERPLYIMPVGYGLVA